MTPIHLDNFRGSALLPVIAALEVKLVGFWITRATLGQLGFAGQPLPQLG